jgi:hypothetical protein
MYSPSTTYFQRGVALWSHVSTLFSCSLGENSVGIQKHFMVAEILGFDLPNRLSDLTTLLFSKDGIGKLIFNKVK